MNNNHNNNSNNSYNKFRKPWENNAPKAYVICLCGKKAKLKIHKNYPFGKKSKAIVSKLYQCDCGKIKLLDTKPKSKRR